MKKAIRILQILVLILLAGWQSGCREAYDPDIEPQLPVLVVDGLLTNQAEPAYVKLSWAVPYNSASSQWPVTDARVVIKDLAGGTYKLTETEDGYYVSDTARFKPVTGHSYAVRIETESGTVFESAPQPLLQAPVIDSIYGNWAEQRFIYKNVYEQTVGKMEAGAVTFADYHSGLPPDVHFRFRSTLLIGFTYIDGSTVPYPTVVYKWKKLRMNKELNITGKDNPVQAAAVKKYSVIFFPYNEYLYDIESNEHIENWFLQVRLYSLTGQAYSYYRDADKQMAATGRIFDPVATQVTGNISCISNAESKALGFFEVSACAKTNVWVKPLSGEKKVRYATATDLDSIAESGISIQDAPFFWKFN